MQLYGDWPQQVEAKVGQQRGALPNSRGIGRACDSHGRERPNPKNHQRV